MGEEESTDLVTLLGRLLSSSQVRQVFFQDRARWLADAGADSEATATLLAIERAGLVTQSQVLLDKRRAEVAENIPMTIRALGPEGGALFGRYAEGAWPTGHLRHLHDAVAFLEWLRGVRPRDINGTEEATLRAHLRWREDAKRMTSSFVAHRDVGPIAGFVVVAHIRATTVHVFLPTPIPAAFVRWFGWRKKAGARG